jgi:hypothetical protein
MNASRKKEGNKERGEGGRERGEPGRAKTDINETDRRFGCAK